MSDLDLVVIGGQQAIRGDSLINLMVALAKGPETVRQWAHEAVDKSLTERGMEVGGLERKALILHESIELLEEIGAHLQQVCQVAAAEDIVEMEQEGLSHLLPDEYDSVQQTLASRAEGATSSHSYDWATLAREVVPFAAATGAIPPEDLDPIQVAKNGNSARMQGAVPALKRIVQDTEMELAEKVQAVQEVMAEVKNRENTAQDIRKLFAPDTVRVPVDRWHERRGWRWQTWWMNDDEDALGRRLCRVFLDFEPGTTITLEFDEASKGEPQYQPDIVAFLEEQERS
jgi:hypothetical protein